MTINRPAASGLCLVKNTATNVLIKSRRIAKKRMKPLAAGKELTER